MKTKQFIVIDETKIYYEIYGKGIPVLIIHGWSVDHNLMSGSMEKVFKKENKNFKRIYVDLPGMGKSGVNPKITTADDVLNILLQFIDRIIHDKNFLLVGESWGGALCRGILHYKKNNVKGLCLLCPVSISGETNVVKPERIILEKDVHFLNTLTKKERELFTSLSVVQTKKYWKTFKRDIYHALINNNKDYLEHVLTGEYKMNMYQEALVYENPVLVLTGRQDNAVGYKDQMRYFMDFPRATIVVLDKAGHNLQIEQETLFQSLLTEWLNRVRTDRDLEEVMKKKLILNKQTVNFQLK